MAQQGTLASRVCAVVQKLGTCTTSQVLMEVGGTISAAQAATAAHRTRRGEHTIQDHINMGRRAVVCDCLCSLEKRGKIRRLRRGVFSPITRRNGIADGTNKKEK